MNEEPYERLQRARLRAGFKGPAEAADNFGWNKNTYKSHENGMRGLTRTSATRYGRAFHVSPAWLLTGEGNDEERPSPEERDFLAKMRRLPDSERALLFVICDEMDRQQSKVLARTG